ncbi:related to phospholipase D [Cephalotrichum gorgonifer]|uniref:Phospholipase n=1 Tax=Cephalotrichum gorgonifer TaxID=2041049 RepID=A0AAE8SU70_9PEZI|nr:related to phospholipase D [Cephalotrichum gorgonifer]
MAKLFDKFLEGVEEKLSHSSLTDAKIALSHQKAKIGKLGNLWNPHHRHDEEHEKLTDEKRANIAKENRHESFFPVREGNMIKWYVDGRDYFWAVSAALENAKETIYIADWWLSPELFLRRPPHSQKEWRLDSVLKRRAEAGVKIYVMVYREVEAALTCNSRHTKHALTNLCPKGTPGHGNIRVMRHPDHNVFENAADMTFYWAHHEKFIVVDYNVAFIGGLDLCFGRWDMHQHPLADLHPTGAEDNIFPGQDMNNNRIKDFAGVDDWRQNELNKAEDGRMPWHDVSMGLIGPCVYDIAEHFVLRWNFIKRDKYKRDVRYDWLMLRGRENEDEDLVGVQRPKHPVGDYVLHPVTPLESKNLQGRGTVRAQIVRSSADWSSGILTDHSIQNAYADTIRKAEHFVYIENQFFITATGDKQSPVHNTIGAAMVDAVLRAAKEGRKFRIIVLIPAIPGFAGDLRSDAAAGTRAIMDYQYKSICRGEESIFGKIRAAGVDPEKYLFFFNLRSYDRIARTKAVEEAERSTGLKYTEVQRGAAEELMPSALHQHGEGKDSTKPWRHGSPTRESHHQRVATKKHEHEADEEGRQAMANKERFEMELRKLEKDPGKVSATVAHHAMASGKDGDGLAGEAWEEGREGEEVNNWIQEELYIHSKLLIADDRVVICGSSNLNDRSQMGSHDSEISIVIEDTRLVDSTMDGKPFRAGWHATTLRRYLWREHLGLLPAQNPDAEGDPNAQPPGDDSPNDAGEGDESYAFVEDALGEELWEAWTGRATTNTGVFRHLFHADPDDHVRTFEDYDRFMPPRGVKPGHVFDQFIPPEDIREKLGTVRGHLVWMSLRFLEDGEMAEKGVQVNQFTESVFT